MMSASRTTRAKLSRCFGANRPRSGGQSLKADPGAASRRAATTVEEGGSMMGFPLEPIEKASIPELRTLQLERLKRQLAHAYDNVPPYRSKFDAAGVTPKDLKALPDLARFPFTTKKDLGDTYPFGMFAVPMDRLVRIHASSGTTGKPTVVGYTKNDIDMWSQVMARSIRAAGAQPGNKVHVSYGYGLFTGGLGAHYGAETLGP